MIGPNGIAIAALIASAIIAKVSLVVHAKQPKEQHPFLPPSTILCGWLMLVAAVGCGVAFTALVNADDDARKDNQPQHHVHHEHDHCRPEGHP